MLHVVHQLLIMQGMIWSVSILLYLLSSPAPLWPFSPCLYMYESMSVIFFYSMASHPVIFIFIWDLVSSVKYLMVFLFFCTFFHWFFSRREKEACRLLLPQLLMPPMYLYILFSILNGLSLAWAQPQLPIIGFPLVTTLPSPFSIH